MSLVQNHLCDNGCGTEMKIWDFFQLSSPEGTHLMLVCGDCLYDSHLEDWNVDLGDDPRYTIFPYVTN